MCQDEKPNGGSESEAKPDSGDSYEDIKNDQYITEDSKDQDLETRNTD